jgi:hypothetical protein
MMNDYLTRAVNRLTANKSESGKSVNDTVLKWTDSKTGLIELMYALRQKGCFNHGQAEIKEIAEFFEQTLDIDLGNYYRTFQEIRIRKSGRTNFLDQLKTVLIQYMDDVDLNYKR